MSQARRDHLQRTGEQRPWPPAQVGAWMAVALLSVILSGCGFLFFGESSTGDIVVDNRTDATLTATYRGRLVERVPPHSIHEMHPGPVEDGDCLIAPMIVRNESNTSVAQVDEGECYKDDRITLVIEEDDLP